MERLIVAALYKFAPLENLEALREDVLRACKTHGICGTLLLAHEGINGTIAGTREGIDGILTFLRQDPRCSAFFSDIEPEASSQNIFILGILGTAEFFKKFWYNFFCHAEAGISDCQEQFIAEGIFFEGQSNRSLRCVLYRIIN